MTRVLFMGTAAFAAPSLRALAATGVVVEVVTQPDRPSGRGQALSASPVKVEALRLGLPIWQPRSIKRPAAIEHVAALAPDLIVVVAFGQILPPAVLELPPHGCLNVHASLLPRHRGASCIANAILAGDATTGVTIMRMDAGLDTGPIVATVTEPILDTDTTGSLTDRLAEIGARLLVETVPRWLAGALPARPQIDAQSTYAPLLRKEQGQADWRLDAVSLWRQCRAFQPWPSLATTWRGRNLRIIESRPIDGSAPPGQVVAVGAGSSRALAIGAGSGLLRLDRAQLEGRKPVTGPEFARGHADIIGATLGAESPD